MIRTQIQLTEEQSRRLRDAARRLGVSAAEVIRRSIDSYLERETAAPPLATNRLAALEVVGRFSSGLTDIAERHDDYLAEDYLPVAKP